jgi:hypothetical protein
VALLPDHIVRAHVAEELEAARRWAARYDHELAFDESTLTLTVPLLGAALIGSAPERYLLKGVFDDYRVIPPAWRFVHPGNETDVGPPAYPTATAGRRGTSIFLATGPTGAVICAHFNRLAYAEQQGPHGDWGAQTNWLNPPTSSYTRAETVGDMLARIDLEVRESAGRMAPLP